jgi:multicomponent K+:H+ antiporter subunit E
MIRLRYPLLTLFILTGWLMLAEHVSPGQTLLAAVAAIGGAWMLSRLRVPPMSLRRPRAIFRLAGNVAIDIARSNFAVARIILSRSPAQHSNFMVIPLELKNRNGLAVLACIITATPGTIWVRYDSASGELLLHILDLVDEDEWMRTIKRRYEGSLREIFE